MRQLYEKCWKPDYCVSDLRHVDWRLFKERGVRLVYLDVDNTLELHGAVSAGGYAREVRDLLVEQGFDLMIVSNARGSRGQGYADSLGVSYMSGAAKPSVRNVLAAMRKRGLTPDQVLLIGDQLFTDVWCARRAGFLSLLVKPLSVDEAWNVRLKRCFERFLHRRFGMPCDTASDIIK